MKQIPTSLPAAPAVAIVSIRDSGMETIARCIHHSAMAVGCSEAAEKGKSGGVTVVLHGCSAVFLKILGIFRTFLDSSRGSSSIHSDFLAPNGLFGAKFSVFTELVLAVTSVTLPLQNRLKAITVLSYTFVTAYFYTLLLLHCCYNLLHYCYVHCYTYCYILISLIIKELYKSVTVKCQKSQVAKNF